MKIIDLLKAAGIALLIGGVILLLPFIAGLLMILSISAFIVLIIGMLYLYFQDKRKHS